MPEVIMTGPEAREGLPSWLRPHAHRAECCKSTAGSIGGHETTRASTTLLASLAGARLPRRPVHSAGWAAARASFEPRRGRLSTPPRRWMAADLQPNDSALDAGFSFVPDRDAASDAPGRRSSGFITSPLPRHLRLQLPCPLPLPRAVVRGGGRPDDVVRMNSVAKLVQTEQLLYIKIDTISLSGHAFLFTEHLDQMRGTVATI